MTAPRSDPVYATAVALALDRLAGRVVAALDARDISSIVLKGPVLAAWLYGDGTPRPYGDVDLLVAPRDLPAAREVVAAHGEAEALVDLVDGLGGIGLRPSAAWPILLDASEASQLGGQDVLVLAPPARALHVALHAAWHGPEPSKPVDDLARALDRCDGGTWREAAVLARRLRAEDAFAAGLSLTAPGRAVARDLGLAPGSGVRSRLGYAAGRPGALRLDDVRRAAGARAKARAVGRAILPPATEMRRRSALARRGRAGLLGAHAARLARRLPAAPHDAVHFLRAVRRDGDGHDREAPRG